MKLNCWLAGASCLLAGVWLAALAEKSAEAQKPVAATITAREVTLVDAHQQPQIDLGTAQTDGGRDPYLIVYGPAGASSVELSFSPTSPRIQMLDASAHPTFIVFSAAGSSGNRDFAFCDSQANASVALVASDANGGSIATFRPHSDTVTGHLGVLPQ